MTRLKNKKYGFTLVEILVVILIIGLLFVFLAPKISNSSDRAKEAGVKTRFNEFRNAATLVMTEHAGLGEVMSSTSDVAGLVGALNEHLDPAVKFNTGSIQGQYCDSVAKDPWNNNYRLHVSDNTLTFISYGHNPMTVHAVDFDYNNEGCKYTLTMAYNMGKINVSTRGFTTNIDDDTPNTPSGGGTTPGGNTGDETSNSCLLWDPDIIHMSSNDEDAEGYISPDGGSGSYVFNEDAERNILFGLSGECGHSDAVHSTVVIPSQCEVIWDDAFSGDTNLVSVTIPGSVAVIRTSAFSGCTNLQTLNLGEGIKAIGNWAFKKCRSLTSVSIPNSVTSIGSDAFAGCTNLKTIYAPSHLKKYGSAMKAYNDATVVYR